MVKEVYTKVQERLHALIADGGLAYVGEDWGQLDLYDSRPPVNFPCCLFDATSADYSDASRGRQDGIGHITIRIADYRPVNVSSMAPDNARAFDMIDTLEAVYRAVQGLEGETFSKLTRVSLRKAKRDDGIREFEMTFRFGFVDNTALRSKQTVRSDIRIDY